MNPKDTARAIARRTLAKLSPDWIQTASAAIQRSALTTPALREAKRLGLYLALPREVETSLLVASARERGQALALPAWNATEARYGMAAWPTDATLAKGKHGILEPQKPAWISMDKLDTVIVTCLAFDSYGWRLGHGGGHFDRLLAGYRGVIVCLAFEAQKMTVVPRGELDVPVSLTITERTAYPTGAI